MSNIPLDLSWNQLEEIEYLTKGGNSSIYTATYNGTIPVIIKRIRSEFMNDETVLDEFDNELKILLSINHPNIVKLYGAGFTSKGLRFLVLERLDGGTLTHALKFDKPSSGNVDNFWQHKTLATKDIIIIARAIADALSYCHDDAIVDGMIIHRDMKPDNIGFTEDGIVKLFDFGLASLLEDSSSSSNEAYDMTGGTGSLRYMAPECAESMPYNHKADVYSFGIILWECLSGKKSYDGMDYDTFYDCVIYGHERPPIDHKWDNALIDLLQKCWSSNYDDRPSFRQIIQILDSFYSPSVKSSRSRTPTPTRRRIAVYAQQKMNLIRKNDH